MIVRPDAHPISPCKPLGAWASLGWSVAALAAWLGAQIALAAAALRWFGGAGNISDNALVISVVIIGAALPALAVIAFAARTARCRILEYLALRWPERRYLVLGLVCLAVLIPLVDLVSVLAGHDVSPGFVIGLYRNARGTGTLPLLVLALVAATPLVEEALFRGLLLPGLAASRLGPAGAIALTSASWALMHLQYEPFYLMQALAIGVTFGWLRWRSGSTLLTVLLHGIVNLTSLLQAAWHVERLP